MNLRLSLALLMALALPGFAIAANTSWMNDLEAAKAKAAKERKPLLIEFTGSTWCPPCQALSAKVLSTPEFAAFSRSFVMVSLDYPPMSGRTPEKIRANPELARLMAIKEKYGVPGFPTMFVYNADGKELTKIVGYSGESPQAYIAKLNAGLK